MSTPFIIAVMVHVQSVSEAMDWYEKVFQNALRSRIDEENFEFLQIGQVKLEFVLADQKVSSGPSGSIVYWQFSLFEEALARFQTAGAKLYRGPMSIEHAQLMCQVQDPWGNCIGLRGPSSISKGRSVAKQLPNPSINRTSPGKPGLAGYLKRWASQRHIEAKAPQFFEIAFRATKRLAAVQAEQHAAMLRK